MKYGLQLSSLSGQIQVGRINKKGTAFLDWEDKTQEFYRAAIDMWGGYEQQITDNSTGKVWTVRMTQQGAPEPSAGGTES